jgi:hypothetical protein
MTQVPSTPSEDIKVFADHCVFMRSIYMHGRALFETSTDKEKTRMEQAAPIFFGDLNRMFVEFMILQVCKITDPALDFRKNENHTIAFLVEHYDLNSDPATAQRLVPLNARVQTFREKLLPARNKLIGHSDRTAIMAGVALGSAPQTEWEQFWLDLQDVVSIIYAKVFGGAPFYINGVAMLSDVDGWHKALKHAACFSELVHGGDSALTHRCVDMALTD